MTIKLSKPFAPNSQVDEYDVRQIKKALNRLGYYQPYEKTGITGIPDREVFEALKEFQKDNSLQPTGEAKPGDESIHTIDKEAAKIPDGHYIWRTVGDDKVRDSHAALDGMICSWSDSPTPGEDFNCRCWAEPADNICKDESNNLVEAQKRVKDLSNKLNDLLLELDQLYKENNELIKNAQENMGTRLVAHLLTLPFKIGILGELLQRFFENTVSDELIKTAEKFMKKRSAVQQKIKYKEKEFALIFNQLNKATKELEDAKIKLEECKKK